MYSYIKESTSSTARDLISMSVYIILYNTVFKYQNRILQYSEQLDLHVCMYIIVYIIVYVCIKV